MRNIMIKKIFIFSWLLLCTLQVEAKLPQIDSPKVLQKVREIMKAHASHKELTPELMKRTYLNYLEVLDPNKTYFIKTDIQQWIEPSEPFLEKSLKEYNQGNFSQFFEIHDKMIQAIARRHKIDKKINLENLPKGIRSDEFKNMQWLETEPELLTRLERIKALQIETSTKLNEELREKALQRIEKHQNKLEEEILKEDSAQRTQLVLSNVLKATTSAMDAHTSYFTPGEATQFMINVQQRLFGIGAQLRDDLNGFTVIKIIEGGPAAEGKELKAKDRIVAVDGELVVGMDIINAVELIRGEEKTPVILTVIREEGEGKDKKETKLDIKIIRREVVLKESRYETSYEPYAEGIIGYLKLFSFYQDPEFSSSADLAKEIQKLKTENKLKGVILDLRYNSGGMLSQAVGVTGLFITKGVVVGIKDNTGFVQYLRDLDGKMLWDGPLIVLVNKASASASEIVAQTLQDYGRAIIVGDENTYGKGSFQTFTLNTNKEGVVNPEGEYKVTRGRYYTVSGKTPQMTGVKADIKIPGPLEGMELGEKFSKYPLENDSIKENFDDDLSDIPASQRQKIKLLYKFDLQKKLNMYEPYMDILRKNAEYRIEHNKNYQTFLKEIKKEKDTTIETETEEQFGQNDLQLTETYNIMKDLILLINEKKSQQE
jgi:carboxyl-terminal processing protease